MSSEKSGDKTLLKFINLITQHEESAKNDKDEEDRNRHQKVADGLKSSLFDYLKWIVPKNHPNVSAKVYEQAVKISDPRNDYVEISSPESPSSSYELVSLSPSMGGSSKKRSNSKKMRSKSKKYKRSRGGSKNNKRSKKIKNNKKN